MQVQPKPPGGGLQGLIRSDDYPEAALTRGDQGTTSVRLTIGANGRVATCSGSGSGSSALDSAACRIIKSRAKFTPAQDSNGQAAAGNFTGRVVWRIAEE